MKGLLEVIGLEDQAILELYFARDEAALVETERSYGGYCRRISMRILNSQEDAEECFSDTLLHAWNAIPPQRPSRLRLFLGRIIRNLSFDRYKADHAQKRGGGELPLVLEELAECIPGGESPEETVLGQNLTAVIEDFLRQCNARERQCFVRRYFFAEPVGEIAFRLDLSSNHVSVLLLRTRKKLRVRLEQEGFYL